STFTSSVTPTYGEDIKEQPTTAETPSTEEANQTTESNVPQKTDTSPSEQTTTEPQATTEVETTPQEEPTTQTATNEEDTNTTSNEEEKVSYPAQNFSKSAGKITVHVSAVEGIFPEGTTMTITPVSSTKATQIAKQTITGNEKVEDAIGVDITFYDSSGKEIEPKDGQGVQVHMQLNESLKGKDFTVVHQEDNGTVQTVSQNASAQGATFQANAFSIYVITGIGTEDEDPAVATYQFHDANGDVYSTQKVKNGEILTAPETPEKEGNIFKGWATSQDATAANFDITQPVSVEKTSTVDLYPVFSQKLYVFFLDKSGRVINTKEGAPGDVITTSDVSVPLGSEESVTGWYTDASLTNPVSEVTLEDHNVTLYPKIEKGHYLYFSTGDNASYIEPEFVAAGKQTQKPNDPTRPGYTFKGWSTTEGGSVNYHFGQTMSDNQTIYAVWSANTDTSYTVIYWKQSINDSKDATDSSKTYDYENSETRTGKTGDVVSPSYSDQNKNYTGFRYNASKSTSVSINGDGTTVLNVYYDRVSMTIHFQERSFWGGTTTLYTFTGLYGQTLEQNGYSWPSPGNGKCWQESDNTILTFLDAFIFDKLTHTTDGNGNQTLTLTKEDYSAVRTIHHYKQNLNGSYTTPTNSTQAGNGSFTFTNKYTGFTVSQYRLGSNGSWTNTSAGQSVPGSRQDLYVRYTRNSYELAFYNYNGVSREESVLYEQSLNSFANYTPARPSGIPDSFTFQGWYKDPELTQKFDFSTTMPSAGLTIYAKWAAPTYTATIHTTLNVDGVTIPIDVEYGDTINASLLPTVKDTDGNILSEGSSTVITIPKDTEWVGWATKDGSNYTTFNLNTKIYNDIELYPYYLSTKKYSVTYDANGGGGSVTDPKHYVNGTYADIQSGKGLTAPNKKSFLYWATDKNGSGTTYYPGDKIEVTGNMTLYAIYGDPAKTTSLTYHSNYPDGVELTKKQTINNSDELENNVSFKAYTNTEAGFAVPNGYYFDGWKDSSGKSIQAGETILVDNTSDNDLYAQWKKKKSLVIQVTGNEASHVYDGKSHSASGYTLSYTVDGKATSGLPSGLTLDESAAQAKAATGKKAGTYAMGLTAGDFEVTGNDLNKYSISIQVSDGHLLVTKRQVTLTSESATKKYDGKALTKPDVTVSGAGFVDDEVSNIKATGSITKVGSTKNTITYTENSDFDKENYDINIKEGTLTITQNIDEIVVTAHNASKIYDGTPLTESNYKVKGLPDGFTAKVTTSGSITDVGETTNKIQSVVIKDSDGKDVTDQFANIVQKNGILTITKRHVTLISESASKAYDGKELTKPDVTVGGDGFVDGEVTDIKAIGTITEVGEVTNTIAYSTQDAFKADNYEIEKNEGTLVVIQNDSEIVVKAKDATKIYDGKTLSADAEVFGLPNGYTADVKTSGSITDAGVAINKISSVMIKNADGKDVTNQFSNINRINGTLKVDKRSVLLSSRSASKHYDGIALTSSHVTIGGDGFVEGEVSDIKATGTITKVGSVKNTITYKPGSNFKADNYEIIKNEGTLTITPNESEIVVHAQSAQKSYDGQPLTESKADVSGLPDGFTVKVTTEGSITDVGSTENKIASVKILKDDEDVTDQFSNIETKNGTLTVNKRKVNLTSDSASKAYDGTALKSSDVTVTGDGFVEGEADNIRATGSITKVGSTTNTIAYDTHDGFKESNYEITKNEGTLTITPNTDKITVTAKSNEKTYDGKALSQDGYKVTGLPDGFTAKVTTEGSITNVGVADNKIASVVIKDRNDQDVTDQFANIQKVNGTLRVNKRKVTLISESARKVYDGKALTKPNVTVRGDGFVEGEVSDIKATGSQMYVGSSDNDITYKKEKNFKDKNYIITLNKGKLTVTDKDVPSDLVVTKKHDSKTYKVGDTITFTIEVTNIYDKAKTITIVEQDDVQITGEKVFTNVAPGATVKTTATHVVTKEDVDAKEYKNVVTAKFDGGKDFDGHDKEDQFDRLEISKTVTSTPKDGQLYRNGETISYKITVKNTGTTVAKNVNVTDDLTGLNETVDELGAGEEKSFDTTYVVTDKDVHAGHIKNVATATSDGNDPVKDEVDTPVETAKPSLIVEKTSDKDHPVKLNETIHYTVTVTNNGNVTIENVTVDDELTDNHWKAGTLKPGESKTFDTQYTVKAEDIAKGKVVNVATADGRDSTGDKPDVTPGEVTNETEKSQPHLTLTKTTTSTPQNKDGYTKGETITYRIKAENDGNVELRDIKVEDPLTKDIWSIESLQPGESKTWTTSYIVTEADQIKGSVVNDVTASAKTSTGDDPVIVPGHTSDKVLTPAKVTKETKNNDTTNTGVATFGGTYAAAMLAAAGLLMSLKRRRDDE
ncbi:MAG: InlB B-repeat-containing protein, partial [Absicoccus porci]|uniref:DUF7507 domain-containing protein n=1 Tax=Absicoccus porci TaxID=2486576 RepID=UPI002E7793E5